MFIMKFQGVKQGLIQEQQVLLQERPEVNSEEVPPGLLRFSFSLLLLDERSLLSEKSNHFKHKKSETGTALVLEHGNTRLKALFTMAPLWQRPLVCGEQGGLGPLSPPGALVINASALWQTLPPCPALCQRHISPPIGPFQQIRCFENDFQGAVGSHRDDIKWKEQKRKKIIVGDKRRWFRMTHRTFNGLV